MSVFTFISHRTPRHSTHPQPAFQSDDLHALRV